MSQFFPKHLQQLHDRLSSTHPSMRHILERPFVSAAIAIATGLGIIAAAPAMTLIGAWLSFFGKTVMVLAGIGFAMSILGTGHRRNQSKSQKNDPFLLMVGKAFATGLILSLGGALLPFIGTGIGMAGAILAGGGVILALARIAQLVYLRQHRITSVAPEASQTANQPSHYPRRITTPEASTMTAPRKGREIHVIRRSSSSSRGNYVEASDNPQKNRQST